MVGGVGLGSGCGERVLCEWQQHRFILIFEVRVKGRHAKIFSVEEREEEREEKFGTREREKVNLRI